jgi:hypothetical protein
MKYIFIENYLHLKNEQKVSFFNYLKENKFKIIQEDIIFEEEAIMFRFENNIEKIEKSIKEYFEIKNIIDINVDIVKKHTSKLNQIILTFIKTNKSILL